jgi:hypothetical protein
MATLALTPSGADLSAEITQLQAELDAAERARVRPEDKRAAEIRDRLEQRKAALLALQMADAQAAEEQQRQQKLATLAEIESEVTKLKGETVALRSLLSELPGRLSLAEFRLNELLRSRVNLRTELRLC